MLSHVKLLGHLLSLLLRWALAIPLFILLLQLDDLMFAALDAAVLRAQSFQLWLQVL